MKQHESRSAGIEKLDDCIRACVECHALCLRSASYCLDKGRAFVGLVTTLQVCADLCRVCADTLIRGSELHGTVCGACAEICGGCAAACEEMVDDAQLGACREACLRCFDTCSAMANEAV